MITLPRHFAFLGILFFLSPQLHSQTELIPNDKFSDGGASWKLSTAADAVANMSIEEVDKEPTLLIDVENTSDKPVDVRVQRLFGELTADKNYRVSFQAKAQEAVSIIPYIYPENQGARVLWRTEIRLEPDWKEFSFEFKGRDSSNDCVLGFSHLGKLTNKYWFKDVVLTSD